MRTRKIITYYDKENVEKRIRKVVWFGSYGKNTDGSSKLVEDYNTSNKTLSTYNFDDGNKAITDSLIQKLSVIKNELWYNMNFGLPLCEKIKSKLEIDSKIIDVILSTTDVIGIEYFLSQIINKTYECSVTINTTFGNINLNI